MTYQPPSYKTLQNSTEELQEQFAQLTDRLRTPTYEELRKKISGLKSLYEKKVSEKKVWALWGSVVAVPDPIRLDQIACIAQLAESFPDSFDAANKDKKEQAIRILTGALLYRNVRLDENYDKDFKGVCGKADDNCALKQSINTLLEISDKNKVDQLTIATSCRAYLDHLNQNNNANKYSYIKKDKEFLKKLAIIIDEAKAKSEHANEKLQYIVFLQSVPAVLGSYEALVAQTLKTVHPFLVEQLKTHQTLNKEEIIEVFKKAKSPEAITNLLEEDVFPLACEMKFDKNLNQLILTKKEMYNEDLKIENVEFNIEIKKRMLVYCLYALLGTYVMVLKECRKMELELPKRMKLEVSKQKMLEESKDLIVKLKKTLLDAIGVCSSSKQYENILDADARYEALYALQKFVKLFGNFSVKAEAWGGIEAFEAELLKQFVEMKNPEQLSKKEQDAVNMAI